MKGTNIEVIIGSMCNNLLDSKIGNALFEMKISSQKSLQKGNCADRVIVLKTLHIALHVHMYIHNKPHSKNCHYNIIVKHNYVLVKYFLGDSHILPAFAVNYVRCSNLETLLTECVLSMKIFTCDMHGFAHM